MNTCNNALRRAGFHLCRAARHAFNGTRELAIGLFHAGNGARLAATDAIVRIRRCHGAW